MAKWQNLTQSGHMIALIVMQGILQIICNYISYCAVKVPFSGISSNNTVIKLD